MYTAEDKGCSSETDIQTLNERRSWASTLSCSPAASCTHLQSAYAKVAKENPKVWAKYKR